MQWDDMIPQIVPYLPGCPQPLIVEHLREGARRFLIETYAWRESLPAIAVFEDVSCYRIQVPEGAEILVLDSCEYIEPENRGSLWPRVDLDNVLQFDEPPKDGIVQPVVVLTPAPNADGIPDDIGLRYSRAIRYAALSELMAIPGAQWSFPNMVATYQNRYLEEVSEAKNRMNKGRTNKALQVRSRSFV